MKTPSKTTKHPSHQTRSSDASTFDEICVNCGATDQVPGGWGELAKPCSKPIGSGGITTQQYWEGFNKKNDKKIS